MILRFVSFVLLSVCLYAAEPGFIDLFDGKSLKGWTMVPERPNGYFVENGMLVSAPDYKGNLFTNAEFANFILRLEFRFTEGANNGIGIRAPLSGDAAYAGMEIQILDHDAARYAKIQPWQRHGSVYHLIPAKPGPIERTEWNEQEITANGSHITVKLNGAVITDGDLASIKDPDLVEKHPGMKRASGRIGLLGHESRVEFRNIRIKTLP
jgi:hypothetical protein